jgi:hypothetical protein
MKRSAGVTVAAIFLLAGSAFMLLCTLLGIVGMFWASTAAPQGSFPRQLLIFALVGDAFVLCMQAFGIATAIGLLRLRNWARITTIVFAGFTIAISMLYTIIFLLIPLPTAPNLPPQFSMMFRAGSTALGLFFLAIGVWWLVLFTRRSVRAQFQSAPAPIPTELPASVPTGEFAAPAVAPPLPPPPRRPGRVPAVIIVVAILLFASVPSMLMIPFMHFPAFFLGKVLYGRAGELFYFAYLAINLTLGISLLRLKQWSLPATIAVYAFGVLNSLPMFLPGIRSAYFATVFSAMPMVGMPPGMAPFPPQVMSSIVDFGLVFGALLSLALIVLMVRARPAFAQAARERASASSV